MTQIEGEGVVEDTYCLQDNVDNQPMMVWLMDTVDGSGRDEGSPKEILQSSGRYLSWADIYVVVYDITSQLSLQYAEALLEKIQRHEHLLCVREHKTVVLGNKNDLERYRCLLSIIPSLSQTSERGGWQTLCCQMGRPLRRDERRE